jgi:ABC-2 type transport system ATP-binding protein
MITLEKLYKRYKGADKYAVENVSLHIAAGEIYGLLGTNGAGKTTIFSMICGLRKISKGGIYLDGKSVKNELSDIKKMIGVVPQDIALFPTLSVYENLRFFGRMYGMKRNELEIRIDRLLSDFNLSDSKRQPVKTRSGGMKRRINLIAGILHRPKILMLDEPAVGIDAHTRLQIMQHLKKLNEQGTTILYTSHYLKEAQDFCRRVGIISEGRLVAEGSPEKLNESYACANLEQTFLEITGVPEPTELI